MCLCKWYDEFRLIVIRIPFILGRMKLLISILIILGYTEVTKLLLADPKVNPSTDDNYPFKIAAQDGHYDIVK
jgi:hypothetical protein